MFSFASQPTDMRILDLPYDVWTIILQLAPRRDVLYLAKASRMTYSIALPSLLSDSIHIFTTSWY